MAHYPYAYADYSYYPSAESSSSALMRSQAAPSSQLQLLSDLPDLYYDHDLPSPPSASSSNIICTPPLEGQQWRAPWHQTEPKCDLDNNPPYLLPWDASSPLSLGQAAPTDPNFAWMYAQETVPEQSESVLFASPDPSSFNPMLLFQAHYYPSQEISNTQPNINFAYAQPTSSSTASSFAAIAGAGAGPSSSPQSDIVAPSAHLITPPTSSASCPPPATGQTPLKLYQPRPSRRIPIISLSKLASACDSYPLGAPPQEPMRGISEQVKPSLGPSGRSSKSYPPISHRANDQFNFNPRLFHSSHGIYDDSFSVGTNNDSGQMARCLCGCMESYICQ